MKKNRARALFAALFIFLCVPLTVIAIRAGAGPSELEGGYYHTLVDRLDITVDHTEFTLKKETAGAETFQIPFTLTSKKCEPDFYAVLNGMELTGMDFMSAEFICATPGLENTRPEGLVLPVQNGQSAPLIWNVTVTADFTQPGDYAAQLYIAYTSGLNAQTADSRQTEIPIVIHVIY